MTNTEKKRCLCKTEEGKRCHNKADSPSIYCYLHKHCRQNHRIHHSKHAVNHHRYNVANISTTRQDAQPSSSPIFASPTFGTNSGVLSPIQYSPSELGRYLNNSDIDLNISEAEGENRVTPLNFSPGASEEFPEYPPRLEVNDLDEPELLVPSSEDVIRRQELENSLFVVQSRFNEERRNPLVAQELIETVAKRLLLLLEPARPALTKKIRFQPSLRFLGPLGKVDSLKNRLTKVGSLRKIILQNAFSSTYLGFFGGFPFGSSSAQSRVEVLDDPIKLFLFRNFPNLNERQRSFLRQDVMLYIQSSEAFQANINIAAILNNLVIPAQLRNGDVETVLVAEQLALENLENNVANNQRESIEVATEKSRVGLVLRLAIIFIANLIILLLSKKQRV